MCPILDPTYKWYHMVFLFLFLTLCLGPSMLLQITLFLSFYGQVVFHCVHVPHLLYPSVSGHLSCFHVLATVNSAAMNISISRSVMSDSLIP